MTHLDKLIHHCTWANEAWITFIQEDCEHSQSDDHLLKLMSHILLGEQAWFQRILGKDPDREIWKTMTLAQLLEMHAKHRGIYKDLLSESVERLVRYQRFTGEEYQSTVADILLHLTLHGAHHRGQLATYTSSKGIKPINTDFVQFCLVNRL